MVVCRRASNAKPRRTFNGAKQRLGGLECVDVRGAAAAEEAKAKAKAKAKEHGDDHRGAQKSSRKVMLGKDGRPLSPLSAAHARAKMGLDPFDEDPDDLPSDITPCPCCGRNFAADRLEVHLEICQKITVNSAQRQTWDSQKASRQIPTPPESQHLPSPNTFRIPTPSEYPLVCFDEPLGSLTIPTTYCTIPTTYCPSTSYQETHTFMPTDPARLNFRHVAWAQPWPLRFAPGHGCLAERREVKRRWRWRRRRRWRWQWQWGLCRRGQAGHSYIKDSEGNARQQDAEVETRPCCFSTGSAGK